jgi:hypothetical protein
MHGTAVLGPSIAGILALVPVFADASPAGEPPTDDPVAAEPAPAEDGREPEPSDPREPESADVETPPEAEPEEPVTAPSKPADAKAPAASSTAKAKAEDEEPPNPLHPKKEAELIAEAEVENEKNKFKPGKGIELKSKDKRFALQIRLRAQMLYSLLQDGTEGTTDHGLQIRRARLVFGGHFFGEHNKFKTEFGVSPRDMGFREGTARQTPIFDWYFEFDYLRDLTVRIGQYKVPYSRQRVVSSADLQLVDRSLANAEFNLDRDVGIDLRSKDFMGWGRLRYYAGVYLGEGRDPFEHDSFELFYLGRIEVLPMGMFEDYSEADFERDKKPKLSLGAAYAFVDSAKRNRGVLGNTPTDGGTTDYHNVTADFVFKVVGLSLTGEFFWRRGFRSYGDATEIDDMGNEVPAPLEAARDGLGWFAQAGYLVPRTSFEIAARYGQVHRLGSDSGVPDLDELGGGLSYYFARHPFKLQLDYFHLWEDRDIAPGSNQIRLQLQAGF